MATEGATTVVESEEAAVGGSAEDGSAEAGGLAVGGLEEGEEEDLPVNCLPPEFFTPLESFDAVRHMLQNLPDDSEGLSYSFLSSQTAQTQVVLDAINSQLSARVMRSYGAFVHGMAQRPVVLHTQHTFTRHRLGTSAGAVTPQRPWRLQQRRHALVRNAGRR